MVHSGYLTKENISIQTINYQIKIPGEQSKKKQIHFSRETIKKYKSSIIYPANLYIFIITNHYLSTAPISIGDI